jgi:uncharacterized membrane protein YfcA
VKVLMALTTVFTVATFGIVIVAMIMNKSILFVGAFCVAIAGIIASYIGVREMYNDEDLIKKV